MCWNKNTVDKQYKIFMANNNDKNKRQPTEDEAAMEIIPWNFNKYWNEQQNFKKIVMRSNVSVKFETHVKL